jgi:hypothetical protein
VDAPPEREVALQELARPSVADGDAEAVAKVVLGVPRDVDAMPTALFPAELLGSGRRG